MKGDLNPRFTSGLKNAPGSSTLSLLAMFCNSDSVPVICENDSFNFSIFIVFL